jgi:hypothetical protein
MTKDKIFKEIENKLREKARAEIQIKMLMLNLRFESETSSTTKKAVKQADCYHLDYCKKHNVDPEDQKLILRKSLSREEVAEELAESASSVYRLLKKGVLKHAPESRDRRIRICSISIYEYLQFGETYGDPEKNKKRNMDRHRPK